MTTQPARPSTSSPTASGSDSSSSARSAPRSTATPATTTACPTRAPPAGRSAAGSPRTCATPRRSIPDEGLSSRTGSPATCCGSSARCSSSEDDQRLDTLQVVDQMGGPQTMLPQLSQFQAADTPERLEKFLARLHAYPAYMAANTRAAARGAGERPDRAADRRRAHDRPARADARDPDRPGRRAGDGRRSPATRTARRSAPSSATRSIPPTPRSSRRCGATTSPRRATENGHLVRAERRGDLPRPRSCAGRRSSSTRGRSTRAASRSSRHRGRAPGDLPRRRLRRRHEGLPGGARRRSGEQSRRPARRSIARAMEDIERAFDAAPVDVPAHAASRLPGHRGRGVQGARRAARLLLPAVGGHDPAGHLLRQHLRPAVADLLAPRRDHLPRGVPGHHFQIALESENTGPQPRSGASARALAGGAYVEGWGLYAERLADEMGLYRNEARALRDARRAGLARGPAGRRHRPARAALDAPAVDRPAARGRPDRDRRGHRDRPLHLLAGAGADVQDRPARDRAAAARDRGPRRRRVRPPRVPRPAARATARCRWRRWPASCPTGWPRRSDTSWR